MSYRFILFLSFLTLTTACSTHQHTKPIDQDSSHFEAMGSMNNR